MNVLDTYGLAGGVWPLTIRGEVDFVMISLHHGDSLSPEFSAWLERCKPPLSRLRCVLLGLLGPTLRSDYSMGPVKTALQELAARLGVPFLSLCAETPRDEWKPCLNEERDFLELWETALGLLRDRRPLLPDKGCQPPGSSHMSLPLHLMEHFSAPVMTGRAGRGRP